MKATHSLSSIYSSFASAETLFATQANWADLQRLISRGHFCLHSPMFHHVSLCFTMFYPCFTMFHPCFNHVLPCFIYTSPMFHFSSMFHLCFTMFHPCFTMFHPCFTMFHPWSTMFHPCFTHVLPCFIYASPMFHHVPSMFHCVSLMFHPCFTMFHPCSTHVSPCSIHVSLCFTYVSSMFHHISAQISKFIFPIGFSNHSSVFGGCSRTWTARWGKCTLLSRNKIGFSVWDSLGWFPFQSPRPHSWPQYSWAARRPASRLVCLQCPLLGVLLLQKAEHMCIPQSPALQRSSSTNSCLRLW